MMTDFDRKLIEKARKVTAWSDRDIEAFMYIADTDEARDALEEIRDALPEEYREVYEL